MATRTQAEEVVLKLTQQVSAPAAVATQAASQLTAQIQAGTAAMKAMQAQSRVDALAQLEKQIVQSSGALKTLQAQMKQLQSGKSVDIEQYRALKKQIDEQQQALAKAKGEYSALSGFAKKAGNEASAAAKKASGGLDAASKAARLLGGSAGATAASVVSFGKELAALGPYGLAAGAALAIMAAGVIGLVAVFTAGLKALGAFRDELLKLQGAMRGNAQAGKEAQAAINAVASSAFNALPREKLVEYATQLGQMRLRGKDLQTALEAAAIAGSAAGDDLAKSVIGAAGAARMAGQSMDQLHTRVKRVWGGVAASQVYSLDVQFRRLRESITALFAGATLDPFISGMNNITQMFSQSTELGQKLQKAVSGAFDWALKLATAALPYVKGAILGAVIAGLQMYIVFLKVRNAIREWIKPLSEAIGPIDSVQMAINAAQAATFALVGTFVVLGAAMLFAFLPVIVILGGLYLAVYLVVAAVEWLIGVAGKAKAYVVDAFTSIADALSGLSLADVAMNLINSFITTITGNIGRVGAALSSMGEAAKSGLKSALGIQSPSRVAKDAAQNVVSTFSGTVESGSGEAEESFDRFVNPKAVKAEAKGARASGRAIIMYFECGAGKGDEEALWEKIRERLRREFDAEVDAVEVPS